MKITFWGTRGSIPAPGPYTAAIGGNTTCVEIETNTNTRIIIDAGTGIRPLGLKLVKENNPDHLILLLTHSHWDHLAGFIFFLPAYRENFSIDVYGHPQAQDALQRDIFEEHNNRYFPVKIDNFRAKIRIFNSFPNPLMIKDLAISRINLNHPGNGYGYRFSQGDRSFAFITDNEIGKIYRGGNNRADLIEFCRGCHYLIHDGQYLPEEIEDHRGWGHSTYEEVLDIAHQAQVPNVILTHHDPERYDNHCWTLLERAREYIHKNRYQINCELAIESQSHIL